jgi:hypothetical protein
MQMDQHTQVEFAGPALRCTACGYDLRAQPADGHCPECARPISASLRYTTHRVLKPEIPVDAASGTPCVRCGTELGGRSSDTTCPICVAPVWLSLDGDWLCVRSPDWLRRLRRGLSLWVWATLISLAVKLSRLALALAAPWVYDFLQRTGHVSPQQFFNGVASGQDAMNLVTSLLDWSAVFLITSPNPGFGLNRGNALRGGIRVLLPIAILCGLWSLGLSVITSDTYGEKMLVVRFVSYLANMSVFLGAVAYTRLLCRLLPDQRLIRGLAAVLWGFGVLGALDFSWYAAILVAGDRMPATGMLISILGASTLLLFVMFGVWLICMLLRFRRKVQEIETPGP